MEKKLVKIGEAAKLLETSPDTLRKWELSGELLPKRKTKGGTRYYDVAELQNLGDEDSPTVCYARVSSNDQLKLFSFIKENNRVLKKSWQKMF